MRVDGDLDWFGLDWCVACWVWFGLGSRVAMSLAGEENQKVGYLG